MKEYTSSDYKEALKRQDVNLLNDGRNYVAKAVVRHFGPIVSKRGIRLKDTTGQLYKYELAGVNLDHTLKEL